MRVRCIEPAIQLLLQNVPENPLEHPVLRAARRFFRVWRVNQRLTMPGTEIYVNSETPTEFENDFFKGRMMFLLNSTPPHPKVSVVLQLKDTPANTLMLSSPYLSHTVYEETAVEPHRFRFSSPEIHTHLRPCFNRVPSSYSQTHLISSWDDVGIRTSRYILVFSRGRVWQRTQTAWP